jgi:hypothetical protein
MNVQPSFFTALCLLRRNRHAYPTRPAPSIREPRPHATWSRRKQTWSCCACS